MVAVAQLVEHRIVIPDVAGSIPVSHPIFLIPQISKVPWMCCPLCQSSQTYRFHLDNSREYQRCRRCELVFVPKSFHLDATSERAYYGLHQNSPKDEGYRRFLNRMACPLSKHLETQSEGLDFGCGPGPTLSVMLEEMGHRVSLYDPFFADHPEVLERCYDFVTCTEVLEHLASPYRVLCKLRSLIRPGGYLGIMTKRTPPAEQFGSWHYIKDPTHVCFWSDATFIWLANQMGFGSPDFISGDTLILRVPHLQG